MPKSELFVRLYADEETVASRLTGRDRINIATADETALFNLFIEQWLDTIPFDQKLELDVTNETLGYEKSVKIILDNVFKR